MAPAVCEMDEPCVHRTMSREITFVGGPRDERVLEAGPAGEPPAVLVVNDSGGR